MKMKKVKMYVKRFYYSNIFSLFFLIQIEQQIHSLFKSKKSIKAKGDAPVLPAAASGQSDENGSSTTTNDTASKLALAKKVAARYAQS
jgi:hypothetical protein